MSNTDSFIDEVTEEVRRDRLFALLRRYGWIAVVVILGIVGGTAWREWSNAQAEAQAQAAGDALVAAMERPDTPARIDALQAIDPASPGAGAVRDFLLAAELAADGRAAEAVSLLDAIAINPDLSDIYRQIAAFKALTLTAPDRDPADLRTAFEALAEPGLPLRLLAQEQLALLDIRAGDIDAAIARLQAILIDAEVTSDLQQRAGQAIVALGGTPEAAAGSDG
jgi:hypothetical protein